MKTKTWSFNPKVDIISCLLCDLSNLQKKIEQEQMWKGLYKKMLQKGKLYKFSFMRNVHFFCAISILGSLMGVAIILIIFLLLFWKKISRFRKSFSILFSFLNENIIIKRIFWLGSLSINSIDTKDFFHIRNNTLNIRTCVDIPTPPILILKFNATQDLPNACMQHNMKLKRITLLCAVSIADRTVFEKE